MRRLFLLVCLSWMPACVPPTTVIPAPKSALPAPPAPSASAQPAPSPCPRAESFDAAAIRAEAACVLARYIRIDTTNPPGNEHAAAQYLAAWLAADGIESRLVESAPGRANLVARIAGKQHGGALVLMHHMDVVPATPDTWSVEPLSGLEQDGYLWGRGSLDNKGGGVMQMLAALLLVRQGVELEHDLVLLAVADEEAGGGHGARFLVAEHPELFEGVSQVLTEGGGLLQLGEGPPLYSIELAQKAPLWLRVTAEGEPGHASQPSPAAASHTLVRALSRLEAHRFPVTVLPEVQALFRARAAAAPEPLKSQLRDLSRSLKDPAFRKAFLAHPHDAALVRNTLSITMLEGSDKENVLSPRASAVLDLRLLPGQDPAEVSAEVERVMDEPAVQVETLLSWRSVPSPRDTPLFAAIEKLAAERDPGAPVTANVIGGFTDCNAFRLAGMLCYGFVPARFSFADLKGMHGNDERIALEALATGVLDQAALLKLLLAP